MTASRGLLAAAVCAVLAVGNLAGCGSSTGTQATGSTASQSLQKPATKPDRLVIRIWSGDEQKVYAETAGKAFTDATGIPIVWDTTDEAVSYAKLNQEIGSGQPPSVDASFNAQQRAYTDAARGWTIPISPELAPNMAKVTAETARPANANGDNWAYVNPYTLSVPFIVRTDKVDPAQIATWNDLFTPNLKQSIAIDSIYSSTAFGFAQSLGVNPATNPPDGMAPVWDRISGLKPNLAQLGSNADVVTALTNGSVSVAISNTGSGISALAAGAPIKMVAPKDGLYVVGDSYYIHKGIPAANAYYAQVFANYVLDPAVQSAVAAKLGFVPVNPAADVPAYMSADPAVFPRSPADLKAENAIVAPIPLMAKNDEAWQKAFDNAIGQ
ncbi:ABC transporter substrate-binding protein [Mycolicibacterium hodleri]|uniref:Extracellular solute-binding protein n=1 Tax=Mycolicibacterium hodleri TaxID=49897 RepID=A0A502DYN1_9MYCO|nr:PotD/PotF family extracellular solute-binding protein [Mycolicibacterium hodleri]TPG29552.1 extracellular solute-binding protein [Mycolicibacterium hodleri]